MRRAVVLLLLLSVFCTLPAAAQAACARPQASLPALEAARDAKFREIRDAELDFHTGKLSREDYRAIDASLRGEAIELLRRLDAVRGKEAAA